MVLMLAALPAGSFSAEMFPQRGGSPASGADIIAGKALFDRWCAECHAPGIGHPGSQQLERVRGAKLALLESRNDLQAEYIRYVVRHGQNAMPAYRPSEITDAALSQISQYLGRNAPVPRKRQP